MAGPPILGPAMLHGHSAAASAMAWMAALIVSATAFMTASLMICSVAILSDLLTCLSFLSCSVTQISLLE